MDIPLEIIIRVYSYASLEACVDLREIDTYWYAAFKQLDETVLKPKVQARNGWIQPGEDGTGLKTWGDCARVFAARTRSKKWSKIGKLDDMDLPEEPPKTTRLETVEVENTLPQDYKPLTKTALYPGFNADLVLSSSYVMDVHTMVATRIKEDKARLMLQRIRGIAPLWYKGIEITVPSEMVGIQETNARGPKVDMNDTVISVANASKVWYLPRTHPDFQQGRGFHCGITDHDDLCSIARGTAVIYRPHPDHIWEYYTPKSYIDVVDMANKKLVRLPNEKGNYRMQSVYNGLLWMVGNEGLFPLFVDRQDATFWYRKDWVVKIRSRGEYCCGLELERYVFVTGPEVFRMIDLSSLSVTEFPKGENDNFGQNLFVGTSGGKLGAWVYSESACEKFNSRLRLQRMLNPRQAIYDLSSERKLEDDFEVVG